MLVSGHARLARSADVLTCAATAAAVGLCYSGLFSGYSYLGPLCTVAAGSALVAFGAAWLGLGPELTVLTGVAGFMVFAEITLFPADLWPGIAVTRATAGLFGALGGGWARMLSVTPPVVARPTMLSTPLALTWISGFLSTTLALGTGGALTPAAPVLGAFAVALALTAGLPGTHLVLGGVLVALFAVLGVIRGARSGRPMALPAVWAGSQDSHSRAAVISHPGFTRVASRLAVACVALTIIGGVGALAGRSALSASLGPRRGPDSLVHPRLRADSVLSPIVALRGQLLAHSPRPLFRMRLSGQPSTARRGTPVRITLASFTHFNGVLWGPAGAYPVTGGALAGAPALAHPVRLTERIQIADPSSPYLPVLGWPLQITFPGPVAGGQIGYDARSGSLLSSRQPPPDLRYDVIAETTSTATVPTDAQPGPLAMIGTDPTGHIVLSQPEASRVRRWISGQQYPYLKLQAIARKLRGLPYTLKAPPGESYATIRHLLSGQEPADDGYDEQHAAAFTLIAQWLGYPARVAVGYLAPRPHHGVYTVTSADTRAWSEVYFTGYGWVPFDPTYPIVNRAKKAPSLPRGPALAPGARPSPPPPPPVLTPVPAPSPRPVPRAEPIGRTVPPGPPGWIIVLAGAALTWAGLWVAGRRLRVVLAKARLRANRRRGTPSQQVAGAWQEVMDRLAELGISFTPAMTASEMIQDIPQVPSLSTAEASTVLRALAVAQTRAVFAPEDCGAKTAQQAWRHERQIYQALYPRWLSWRRLRALLDPRPLRVPGGPRRNEVS